MYAINTFLRLVRFIASSFIGLALGFALGYYAAFAGFAPIMQFVGSYFE